MGRPTVRVSVDGNRLGRCLRVGGRRGPRPRSHRESCDLNEVVGISKAPHRRRALDASQHGNGHAPNGVAGLSDNPPKMLEP